MVVQSSNLDEGTTFNRLAYNRIYKKNQNVLAVDIGGTGTGKSYRQLRVMEIWYRDILNKPFPADHICFDPVQVMELLSGDRLKRGDMIIYEEAGTSLGAKDFMDKRVKMFNYIMQSFRFRNLILMFNLPNVMMLSKDLRRMLHFCFESDHIDYNLKINYCKPFRIIEFARSDKEYFYSPRIKYDRRMVKVKQLGYYLPSQDVIDIYEKKKREFFDELNSDVKNSLINEKEKRKVKIDPDYMTSKQKEVYNMLKEGMNGLDIAKKLNKAPTTVYDVIKALKLKNIDLNFD